MRPQNLLAPLCLCAIQSYVSLAAVPAAATPLPRPALIAVAVRNHGAKTAVADLLAHDQWNALVTEIGAGNADWIALAPKLAPGTDAATSISLGLVLAHALTLDAPAVLSVLDAANRSPLAARRVCVMPALSLPMTQLASYQAAAIAAVEPVSTPALAAARGACLNALTGAGTASPSYATAYPPSAERLPHAHFTRADFRTPPVHPAQQPRWRPRTARLTTRIVVIRRRGG